MRVLERSRLVQERNSKTERRERGHEGKREERFVKIADERKIVGEELEDPECRVDQIEPREKQHEDCEEL